MKRKLWTTRCTYLITLSEDRCLAKSGLLWCGIRPLFLGIQPLHGYLFSIETPLSIAFYSWNVDVEPICLLYGEGDESRNHLFFECSFSSVVWRSLLRRFCLSSVPLLWSDILLWLPTAHPDAMVKLGILQVWQASIYELWKERNRRSHEGLTHPPARIMRYISETLRDKCSALLSLGHPLGPRLARFWFDPP